MIIVCLSDTHELHREVEVAPGDLLIHAGDFTFLSQRPSMLRDFNDWLGELPHPYKLVIPGNHDFLVEKPENRNAITNAMLLIDSGVEIGGMRIWGSPVTALEGAAFGKAELADRKRHWEQIPESLDVLVTHAPAYGILDQETRDEKHQGCPELRKAVLRVRPRLHVCGHVHGGYGTLRTQSTLFVNAALYDGGCLSRAPLVLNLPAKNTSRSDGRF